MINSSRWMFLICAVLIFAIGLIMIFSTTSADVLDHDLAQNTHQAVLKHLIYGLIGLIFALLIYKIGLQKLIHISPILLFFFSILLILTLIPGIGREVNGSKRWLSLAGISFQPSEFVKYIIPAYFIYRLQSYQYDKLNFKDFLKVSGLVGIPIFLILIEPNNGTAAVICMTLLILCLLMHIPLTYWAIPLSVIVIVGGVSAYNLPYVQARLRVYMNPELDLKGKGHQPYQAKIAAGSGKFLGKGPGNSWQKLSYLPEAQNDYIGAIFAEEYGFLGICILITLYMILSLLGLSLTMNCANMPLFFYGASIIFLISFQAFLNLGVVSGLLPSTGLNLPLFSQGGTSLIANIIGIGILLSLPEKKDKKTWAN